VHAAKGLGDHVVVAFEAVDVEPRRRERIDCLRSGLDGPVEPAGFEAALDGLPGVRIVNRQKSPNQKNHQVLSA
jgi:hypothetical protein